MSLSHIDNLYKSGEREHQPLFPQKRARSQSPKHGSIYLEDKVIAEY